MAKRTRLPPVPELEIEPFRDTPYSRRDKVEEILVERANKDRAIVIVWRHWGRSRDIDQPNGWIDLGLRYTLGEQIAVNRLDDERFKICGTHNVLTRY